MRPLAPRSPAAVAGPSRDAAPWPATEPLTLAQAINQGSATCSSAIPRRSSSARTSAVKGGVYGVTRGLHARFGAGRVFDTLLDETSILGLALGAAISGFLPIPEIQYLAYLHNAEDQLRGEAATLQFFSQGRYRNGMVVRIAGYGYQKGFGGHFHNDDAVAVLRDIPGLVIASPSRPDDAAAMLRTCVAAAQVDGSVCVFLEPIALYHTRDLLRGRRRPLARDAGERARPARLRAHVRRRPRPDDPHVGQRPSAVAARRPAPASERGVDARVVDLRWLAPLPIEDSPARRRRRGASSSSTRRAARAASPRGSWRCSSTPASTARSRAWRARTRSSRSATPPTSCSSPRTRSRRPRSGWSRLGSRARTRRRHRLESDLTPEEPGRGPALRERLEARPVEGPQHRAVASGRVGEEPLDPLLAARSAGGGITLSTIPRPRNLSSV